ncbi:MAG: DsbC family protein [Betaproteobacteria bacterium]|jgi:thiol:disulfide interchange protein DsbC|nr:MAG: DsbC family protein [Betaproteobacteria bacterium]
MMRLRLLTYFIILSGIAVSLAHAGDDELRAAIKEKFPNANVQSILELPALGLYELVIDGSVYYSDAKFEHLIDGNIIEIKSMRNLTSERKRAIEEAELRKVAIAFDDLPLANAFKKVYGNGSRRMAYFADPNCGYCKRFDRETLPNINNATVYVFLYPIIAAQSVPTSKSIWCSADRERAWDEYVIKSVAPKASPDCDNPVDDILAFGYSKRIRGTPTLFFADGSRISGALTLEQLEQRLVMAEENLAKTNGAGGS